jgi:hypothetical protein
MNISYERVSTIKQDVRRQKLSVDKYNIDKKYIDKASGKNIVDRPQLNKLMNEVNPGDLFESGTTRAQIEEAARILIEKGTRITDPSKRLQVFEKVIKVNGKRDLVRITVDSGDANRVITIFPVRGG